MAESAADSLSRIVKSMTHFILRLHYSDKGKNEHETLPDVHGLPEPLQYFIMNFFNKYKDQYDQRVCQCIAPNPNCVKNLMDGFDISFHEPLDNVVDPEGFITWCCKLSLQAALLYEHEFTEAPNIAIEFIVDTCEKNNKYASFVLQMSKS